MGLAHSLAVIISWALGSALPDIFITSTTSRNYDAYNYADVSWFPSIRSDRIQRLMQAIYVCRRFDSMDINQPERTAANPKSFTHFPSLGASAETLLFYWLHMRFSVVSLQRYGIH